VLQTHHHARSHQRAEHRVAAFGIEAADFGGARHAHLIAWRHGEQEFLEFVETCIRTDGS
jgi:hypothetical protein